MARDEGEDIRPDVVWPVARERMETRPDPPAPRTADAKLRSVDLLDLRPGARLIDIGCGDGTTAELIAQRLRRTGCVIGIDSDLDAIARAIARTAPLDLEVARAIAAIAPIDVPLGFRVGDATAIDFEDDCFDGARAEHVLAHLADPARAIGEMRRVVRPGGRLVAHEADWGMAAIASSDPAIEDAARRHVTASLHLHGRIGRELRALMAGAGCRDVSIELLTTRIDDLAAADRALSLRVGLEGAIADGKVTAAAGAAWWGDLEARDRDGRFFAAMTSMIAVGTV